MTGVTIQASSNHGRVTTINGADGRYTLRVVDGTWTVTVDKAGYLPTPISYPVTVPSDQTNLDFTLIPAAELLRVYLPLLAR